jgi:hypothetical protein
LIFSNNFVYGVVVIACIGFIVPIIGSPINNIMTKNIANTIKPANNPAGGFAGGFGFCIAVAIYKVKPL